MARPRKYTSEEKHVVLPLEKWFRSRKANWNRIIIPNYGTAATGWDLEVERKNQVLLIEAKYISGPFLASFGGLVTAPLAHRNQRTIKRKYRSWCAEVCWAIGSRYENRNVYQIFLDYIGRNMDFWRSYGSILRMKYVFFVEDGRVTRLTWNKILRCGEAYVQQTVKIPNSNIRMKLAERRAIAEAIMRKYARSE